MATVGVKRLSKKAVLSQGNRAVQRVFCLHPVTSIVILIHCIKADLNVKLSARWPLAADPWCWDLERVSTRRRLISHKIIFEVFRSMRSRYLNVTDGKTDDLQWQYRALW